MSVPAVFAGTASTIGGWRCTQYDGIVAMAAGEHFGRGRGVNSMMVALLIAGIGLLLAGLVGDRVRNSDQRIQLRQYPDHRRYGRGLHRDAAARPLDRVRELKEITQRLGLGRCRRPRAADAAGSRLPRRCGGASAARSPDRQLPASAEPRSRGATAALAWRRPPPRDRAPDDAPAAPPPAEPAPAAKPRAQPVVLVVIPQGTRARPGADGRSIHDRCSSRAGGRPAGSRTTRSAARVVRRRLAEAGTFARPDVPPPRRAGRTPSTFAETGPAADRADYPPAARQRGAGRQVTVLKSGVVDGMAYSLYSDGSIEAQMPEGMMRFASIDELRAHLDQRP